MEFVLADPSYTVRKERKDDHVDYDAFGSDNMKEMVRAMGNVMKTEAHGNVYSLALQLILW